MSEFQDDLTGHPRGKENKDLMTSQELLQEFLAGKKERKIRNKSSCLLYIDSSSFVFKKKGETDFLVFLGDSQGSRPYVEEDGERKYIDDERKDILLRQFINRFTTIENEQEQTNENDIQSITDKISEKIKKI